MPGEPEPVEMSGTLEMTTLLTSILAGLEQHSNRVNAALQAAPGYDRPKIVVPPGGRRLLWVACQNEMPFIGFEYVATKNQYICWLQGAEIIEADHFTAPQFVAPGCNPITFEFNCSPDQYLAALAELVK